MQKILNYLTAAIAAGPFGRAPTEAPLTTTNIGHQGIPLSTRHYWMRRANHALFDITGSPCPLRAFGSVIVNHTAGGLGELVCIGANDIRSGNPTIHGEIAAINNCSAILTDPKGPYKLSGHETQNAWADLTLYTNAEPCPMCASAIRWGGFRELVFGSTTKSLQAYNWNLMSLSAEGLFKHTKDLGTKTALYGGVLANETDAYFSWQFTDGSQCPPGCYRDGSTCSPDRDSLGKSPLGGYFDGWLNWRGKEAL